MMPAPTEETEVAEPLILDAELVEEATMEETEVSVEETTPTPERETLLEPRRPPTLADTSFVPRRIRQLHPKRCKSVENSVDVIRKHFVMMTKYEQYLEKKPNEKKAKKMKRRPSV